MAAAKVAPVITPAQQRQTLAAKKKKPPPRQPLKNVLAQPFDRFWPQCDDASAADLIERLAAVRLPANDDEGATDIPVWRSAHCTIGLQATLRRLNKPASSPQTTTSSDATKLQPPPTRIDLLLLAADIRPRFIVDQILMLARAHNPLVRCVLVPALQERLQPADRLALPACMCVALSDCAAAPAFGELNASLARLQGPRYCAPAAYQQRHVAERSPPPQQQQQQKPAARPPRPAVCIDSLHLQRSADAAASGGRAFVPAGTEAECRPSAADWSDFISLGPAQSTSKKLKHPKKIAGGGVVKPKTSGPSAIEAMRRKMQLPAGGGYRTLAVNRVQGNPNKVHKPKPPPPGQKKNKK